MAGFGGDKWGASGGGIDSVGTPAPLKAALSKGSRQTNYETTQTPPPTTDMLSEMSTGRIRGDAFNGVFIEGYSTAGNPVVNRAAISPPVPPSCSILGSCAVAAFAIPGCMIPGVNFS